jgi:hypothetical protein
VAEHFATGEATSKPDHHQAPSLLPQRIPLTNCSFVSSPYS